MKAYWIAALLVATVAGCADEATQPDRRSSAAETATNKDGRPVELAGATPTRLGAACFLERVNNVSVREAPTLRTGTAGVFYGWASVADPEKPAPPLVYLVLRRQGAPAGAAVYLKMGRMPRPDLMAGDARRELVGFEGEHPLPAAGTYRVEVSQGTGQWQTPCDTAPSSKSQAD